MQRLLRRELDCEKRGLQKETTITLRSDEEEKD